MSASGPGLEPTPVDALPSVRNGGPEVAARVLGEFLRQAREQRGYRLKHAAAVIRGSVSKVSRLERGESPPKERDVFDLVRFYGLSESEAHEVDCLLQQVQGSEWWHQYADVTPGYLKRLIGLEGAAERIFVYENAVVPGLLQTPDYARAVVRAVLPDAEEEDIERRVQLRISRQRLFDGPRRPRVMALLAGGILQQPIGGREVMCAQLEHLLQLGGGAGVFIRLVEPEQGAGVAPNCPITHLQFGDDGPAELVYLEHIASATYVTKPAEVERYRLVLNRVSQAASSRERSEDLLRRAIERYRSRRAP
jgi:transcriptional regulator with XRE-family HTH domain